MLNGARGQNEMDEEQGGREREEAANSTSLTKVDVKELWSEICHFKAHFTMKGFFLGLILGLIPSGWDTFSDFAFAADDHNRTVELINATNKFLHVTIMRNGHITRIFTCHLLCQAQMKIEYITEGRKEVN